MDMREILFRGKRVDNGEWVEGFYIEANHHWHNKGIHKEWIVTNTIQNGGWCNVASKYAVIPETVGQYTGLTDKNGQKIFEGDIAKVYDRFTGREHSRWPVVTIKDSYTVQVQSGSGWCPQDTVIFEVIGNIHEQGVQ